MKADCRFPPNPGFFQLLATRARIPPTASTVPFLMKLPLSWEDMWQPLIWVWVVNWIRVGCQNMPEWQVYSSLCVDSRDWQHLWQSVLLILAASTHWVPAVNISLSTRWAWPKEKNLTDSQMSWARFTKKFNWLFKKLNTSPTKVLQPNSRSPLVSYKSKTFAQLSQVPPSTACRRRAGHKLLDGTFSIVWNCKLKMTHWLQPLKPD